MPAKKAKYGYKKDGTRKKKPGPKKSGKRKSPKRKSTAGKRKSRKSVSSRICKYGRTAAGKCRKAPTTKGGFKGWHYYRTHPRAGGKGAYASTMATMPARGPM